ncbi:MAG: helix-turn-helix domain-containing protein [Pyrinomonadaceae bacterium]
METESNTEKIISQLIARRRKLGVTQHHLAELAGLSEISVKKIETRKTNPTVNTIAKLADVLGLELNLQIKRSDGPE